MRILSDLDPVACSSSLNWECNQNHDPYNCTRFHGEKKEELVGVAANRVMRMNLQTGDHVKTWRYSTMKVSSYMAHLLQRPRPQVERSLFPSWLTLVILLGVFQALLHNLYSSN